MAQQWPNDGPTMAQWPNDGFMMAQQWPNDGPRRCRASPTGVRGLSPPIVLLDFPLIQWLALSNLLSTSCWHWVGLILCSVKCCTVSVFRTVCIALSHPVIMSSVSSHMMCSRSPRSTHITHYTFIIAPARIKYPIPP